MFLYFDFTTKLIKKMNLIEQKIYQERIISYDFSNQDLKKIKFLSEREYFTQKFKSTLESTESTIAKKNINKILIFFNTVKKTWIFDSINNWNKIIDLSIWLEKKEQKIILSKLIEWWIPFAVEYKNKFNLNTDFLDDELFIEWVKKSWRDLLWKSNISEYINLALNPSRVCKEIWLNWNIDFYYQAIFLDWFNLEKFTNNDIEKMLEKYLDYFIYEDRHEKVQIIWYNNFYDLLKLISNNADDLNKYIEKINNIHKKLYRTKDIFQQYQKIVKRFNINYNDLLENSNFKIIREEHFTKKEEISNIDLNTIKFNIAIKDKKSYKIILTNIIWNTYILNLYKNHNIESSFEKGLIIEWYDNTDDFLKRFEELLFYYNNNLENNDFEYKLILLETEWWRENNTNFINNIIKIAA